MFYLITDQDGKDWRGNVWGPGVTLEESNDNYHFCVYHAPQTAIYMYPCFEQIKNPRLWVCTGEKRSREDGFRSSFAKLTVSQEYTITFPTTEQHITFGILCAMNLVTNQTFRAWALKYLAGEDQTLASAQAVEDHLLAQMAEGSEEYLSACHGVLSSVLRDDPPLYSACAAHKAYHDSIGNDLLDLPQLAQIVSMVSAKDIAQILG